VSTTRGRRETLTCFSDGEKATHGDVFLETGIKKKEAAGWADHWGCSYVDSVLVLRVSWLLITFLNKKKQNVGKASVDVQSSQICRTSSGSASSARREESKDLGESDRERKLHNT